MCGGFSPGSNSFRIRLQNKECYMLDLKANRWRALPNLPEGVSYATAIFWRGHLMVLGGYRDRQKVAFTQVLDLKSKRWRVFRNGYPFGVWGHCTVVTSDGLIHSTGGWSDTEPQANLKSNLVLQEPRLVTSGFDGTSTDMEGRGSGLNWSRRNSMNVGRGTHACLATYYKVHFVALTLSVGNSMK